MLIVTLLVALVALPMALYVTVSLPPVQNRLRALAEDELTRLLDSRVTIGQLSITPINNASLQDVTVYDGGGDTALYVRRAAAGLDIYSLLARRKISIAYTMLRGVDARLSRDSVGAPLNIDNIIKALSPKDKNKPPTRFEFNVNTIIMRQWALTYDVKSLPAALPGQFDPNHIKVDNLRADIRLPLIKNDDFTADIRRLAFDERSGLSVTDLSGRFHVSDKGIETSGVSVNLPSTTINLGDIELSYDGWNGLKSSLTTMPIALSTGPGSHVTPADLSAFLPALAAIDAPLDLDLDVRGSLQRLNVYRCVVGSPSQRLYLSLEGDLIEPMRRDSMEVAIPALAVKVDGGDIAAVASSLTGLSPSVTDKLSRLGTIRLSGKAAGSLTDATAQLSASADIGELNLVADYRRPSSGGHHVEASVTTPGIDLGLMVGQPRLSTVVANISAEATISGGRRGVSVDGDVKSLAYNGYNYRDISLNAILDGDWLTASLSVADPNADLDADCSANIGKTSRSVDGNIDIRAFNPSRLNLWNKYPGYTLTASASVNMAGNDLDTASGRLSVAGISFTNDRGDGFHTGEINLTAESGHSPKHIELTSDLIDCELTGDYHFATLWPQVKEIVTGAIPVLDSRGALASLPATVAKRMRTLSLDNDFNLSATLKENSELSRLIKLPVTILAPVEIQASVNHAARALSLSVDAPYLQQKDKLIENSTILATVDGLADSCALFLTTQYPTKHGSMPLVLQGHSSRDKIDTRLKWNIERRREYRGDLSLSAVLSRDDDNKILADVTINPGEMVFNDSLWTVHPATIAYRPRDVSVGGFNVSRSGQYVKIDGRASADVDDKLDVNLLDVNLDYIFESLGLDNVMLGGDATGDVTASGLFSSTPTLLTDSLRVKNISYNRAVIGDALIHSHWDNARGAVNIDADILQPNEAHSRVYGDIFVLRDSLDMRFECNQTDARFMAPYMAAFASDVSGLASGHARLWGNFKYIDFEGAVLAQDIKMRINFTNTVYTATDSIRFTPGRIELRDILLFDNYGHNGTLNGVVSHKFFKEPSFDFTITDATDLLAYDMPQKLNPDWFGRVFGSGTAFVKGKPGRVDIGANMTTGPGSTFTFVLSDRQDANEYNFITFRDKAMLARRDSLESLDSTPEAVKRFRRNMKQQEEATASVYNLNFDIGVTPMMKMVLVMDPEGGDQVTAYGSGNIHMGYDSSDEDLVMRGVYTVDRGTYNFTLQDIIIKDFTINSGSSVSFHGSPYNANLDLTAAYTTTANLSDLDESFLQDKELNRTNVPVQALLKVSGDMRSPELGFDLAFPTLTNDTYRKVRSIVSTDEMMNRQIIYLLALNRFYTPDYMASTTKGNELVSVASSTISSQLSSILGRISDNWTIAPNVRSDRGDFSDVEVDLALSSQLLNNRLIFNGNLGYRDKSLNTNQFIGDFDIEYLLNRTGNLRLKAYNRYNDQNYYIKTATTTQGIGIMFRRDFDKWFNFMRRRQRQKAATVTAQPSDTGSSER